MSFLHTAVAAAREAGSLLLENFEKQLDVNEMKQYDIKLDLDVKTQELITRRLLQDYPEIPVLGEEGYTGERGQSREWIVDPIDGTVNYFYGIPHFCVSIALREGEQITVGVIYDPSRDEMWTVERGSAPKLNGKELSVSQRKTLGEALVTVGFSKSKDSLDAGLKRYGEISYRVRKTRLLGSAALALAYIATGRLDAYVEEHISLWDIAAGVLMVEEAGGKVDLTPKEATGTFSIVASNGHLQEAISQF